MKLDLFKMLIIFNPCVAPCLKNEPLLDCTSCPMALHNIYPTMWPLGAFSFFLLSFFFFIDSFYPDHCAIVGLGNNYKITVCCN